MILGRIRYPLANPAPNATMRPLPGNRSFVRPRVLLVRVPRACGEVLPQAIQPPPHMPIPIPLAQPDITQREIDAVVDVLHSSTLSIGPKLEQFERHCA